VSDGSVEAKSADPAWASLRAQLRRSRPEEVEQAVRWCRRQFGA
jgi:hypothetical protein